MYTRVVFQMSILLSVLVEVSQWFQNYWARRGKVTNKKREIKIIALKVFLPWAGRLETVNASIAYLSAPSSTCKADIFRIFFLNQEG